MPDNIDTLIATFPTQLQENYLRALQGSTNAALGGQRYQANALALQQQLAAQNALRNIYGNQANIDPATGLPRPAALGPLMQTGSPMGLDFLETGAKLNDANARAAALNMRARDYYGGLFQQGVADPVTQYAASLDPRLPQDQRNQMIAQQLEERKKETAAQYGVPDPERERWDNIGAWNPSWALGSERFQARQAAIAKGWKDDNIDYGTGQTYSTNPMYPGLAFDRSHTQPYTPSGVSKLQVETKGPAAVATGTGPDGKPYSIKFRENALGQNVDFNDPTKRVNIPDDAKITPISTKDSQPGLEASKTLEVLDKDGNVLRTVLAREARNKAGWVESDTGKPLVINKDKGETLKEITPSASTGGRAGAQVIRQEIAGREVLSDLQNAVSLPLGTTIGWLGQAHPGTSILGAIRGDLTRRLTDQDSQLMQASMASMSRELSILMSPVYGGNWAAQQIDPLVPQSGNTLGVTMFKLARLSQSANNALEAASKSPVLSNEQRKYAVDLQKEISKAIPWTTADALKFAQAGKNPGESFGDFVKRGGLEGKPSAPATSRHDTLDAAKASLPADGKPYTITGPDGKSETWTKSPDGKLTKGP